VRSSSGSLAKFTAIRRASSLSSTPAVFVTSGSVRKGFGVLDDSPWRREAAGRHHHFFRGMYGFHCKLCQLVLGALRVGSKRAVKTCPLRRRLSSKGAIAAPSTWRGRKPVAAVALIVPGAAAASTSRTFCLDHVGARPVFPGASTHDISNRSVARQYQENGEAECRFAGACPSAFPGNRRTCSRCLPTELEPSAPSRVRDIGRASRWLAYGKP
jgi:hypothetical protein